MIRGEILAFSLKQFQFVALIFAVNANTIISAIVHRIETRIVDGVQEPITQAPYQVSLRKKAAEELGYGKGHVCGGSVVSQRLIITAAHCVNDNAAVYTVVMGASQLYTADNDTLQFNVLEIIPHSNYDPKLQKRDIAAVFLDGIIPWNWATVSAIPLNRLPLAENTMCVVTGWGRTNDHEFSPSLMAGYVPIVNNSRCSIYNGSIPIDKICAGYIDQGGADACHGDSGGPLVCVGVLAGVISYGYNCGRVGFPGVYTNVSYFYDWIIAVNRTFNYNYYIDGAFSNRESMGTVYRIYLWVYLVIAIWMVIIV